MEWISVKDRLPDDPSFEGHCCPHDVVLLWVRGGKGAPRELISLGQWYEEGWEVIGDGLGGHSCTGFWEFDPKDVTHWAFFDAPDWEGKD